MREIIEFWRAVEMFSPPAIPQARPAQRVFDVAPGEPLPWSPEHPVQATQLTRDQAWRHTVYVGLYPREAVFSALKDVFPPAPDSYEERPSGQSALLGFVASEKGILLEGSAVLSACAWATARALDPGPSAAAWLDGFADIERGFASGLEETLLGRTEEQRRPVVLDWGILAECLEGAIAALGVEDVLPISGVRVSSEIVARRSAGTVEHDFLNSFIADDLARVAVALGAGEVGAALREYLRPTAELDLDGRIDVRTRLDEVRRATEPDRLPPGRWPAGPERPLALGQQLAVNEAIAMPRAGGNLFAVNGPPGTGKTTMLRDLVAGLVTERAERLAALTDPADAFLDDPDRWETTPYRRVIHRLRPELTGFELVLASSNNGAVENVTLEIPSSDAVDGHWRELAEEIDYFPALAERAMSAVRPSGAAWALVAARLGNSKNRKDFVNAVWWTERRKEGDNRPPPGLRDLLANWEDNPEGPSWAEAVAAFEEARDRASAIREDRLQVAAALHRVAGLESDLEAARAVERAAGERVQASLPRREELASLQRTREDERRRRVEAREEELRRRPSVIRFRARAAWRERDEELAAAIAALDTTLDEVGEELRVLEGEARAHTEAGAVLAAAEKEHDAARRVLARYRERTGALMPDEGWRGDRVARERQAPWT
ncbi:MAG TPA: hypothetical protein VGH93_01320, partial [Solirubrobacteraceae bacterium]